MPEFEAYKILLAAVVFSTGIVLFIHLRQQKEQRNKLKKLQLDSDQKYLELADLLPQIVFESDEQGIIRFLNSNGLKILGLTRIDIQNGINIKHLVVEKEQNSFWEDYLYILTGGLNRGQQYLVQTKEEGKIPMMFYMSQVLEHEKGTGVRGIIIDISEQKILEQKILAAVLETEDRERKRFSEDLHDGLGPLLSTVKLYVNQIHQIQLSDEDKNQLLISTTSLLDEAIGSAKSIANNILPGSIADNGLIAALNSFCNRIESTGTININLETNLEKRIAAQLENTLYRIIIELINNTIKHAQANEITISIQKQNQLIELSYTDDGVGFDVDQDYPGLGMKNIKNRCASIGAELKMTSKQNNGFKLLITIEKP
jgi:PAS domain S-box-containing protein